MNKTLRQSHRASFSSVDFDEPRGTIKINGVVLELTPRQSAVLSLLLARPGQVVTRKALIDSVWDGNHFIGDRGLSDIIYQLRKLFSELDPQLIKTIPRKGYVLLGEVAEPRVESPDPKRLFVVVSGLAAILAIGFSILWFTTTPTGTAGDLTLGEPSRLFDAPGSHFHGDMSASGKFIAYIQPGADGSDLIIEEPGTGNSTVVQAPGGWAKRWPPGWVRNEGLHFWPRETAYAGFMNTTGPTAS